MTAGQSENRVFTVYSVPKARFRSLDIKDSQWHYLLIEGMDLTSPLHFPQQLFPESTWGCEDSEAGQEGLWETLMRRHLRSRQWAVVSAPRSGYTENSGLSAYAPLSPRGPCACLPVPGAFTSPRGLDSRCMVPVRSGSRRAWWGREASVQKEVRKLGQAISQGACRPLRVARALGGSRLGGRRHPPPSPAPASASEKHWPSRTPPLGSPREDSLLDYSEPG